jgi:hypothetical protein
MFIGLTNYQISILLGLGTLAEQEKLYRQCGAQPAAGDNHRQPDDSGPMLGQPSALQHEAN